MAMNKTIVVFRKWKDGAIVALFPCLPADRAARYCESYEHAGQHGAADYQACIRMTSAAVKDEYRWLAQELINIGYELDIKQRAPSDLMAKRRANLYQESGQ